MTKSPASKFSSYRLIASVLFLILLFGCVSHDDQSNLSIQGSNVCKTLRQSVDWGDAIKSLNRISIFYQKGCYEDVVEQVTIARDKLSHKTFSIAKEALEFLIPEGKVTDYVLESYERGYISFMASASYVKLNKQKSVLPELNKLYNEESALTYNHGRDPVNALVQAAMWDNFGDLGFSSRPFWLWLKRQDDVDPILGKFVEDQIVRIDGHGIKEPSPRWRIYELGRFPEVDWDMKFTDNDHGYFRITPKQDFPSACEADGGVLVPTKSWFAKISKRHAYTYHPLVNVKSWIRLPVGLVLGVSTYTTGAAIAIGGCAADVQARAGGDLCKLSISGGKAVVDMSPSVMKYALQPDLRHWEELPAAIAIVPYNDNHSKTNRCLQAYSNDRIRLIL